MTLQRPFLLPANSAAAFPEAQWALSEPNGLLAIGGDLSPQRLLNAYAGGIFPWFSPGQPVLWWSPDPRTVFDSGCIHLSRRFRRQLRTCSWVVRADTAFAEVIYACATIRRLEQDGTWITPSMRAAYNQLHRLGYAHSIEVWDESRLVGGLYGVGLGRLFFAESMFSAESGGSKVALAALAYRLAEWGWPLIDAQMENAHLSRLGAFSIPRTEFLRHVRQLSRQKEAAIPWTARFGLLPATQLAH